MDFRSMGYELHVVLNSVNEAICTARYSLERSITVKVREYRNTFAQQPVRKSYTAYFFEHATGYSDSEPIEEAFETLGVSEQEEFELLRKLQALQPFDNTNIAYELTLILKDLQYYCGCEDLPKPKQAGEIMIGVLTGLLDNPDRKNTKAEIRKTCSALRKAIKADACDQAEFQSLLWEGLEMVIKTHRATKAESYDQFIAKAELMKSLAMCTAWPAEFEKRFDCLCNRAKAFYQKPAPAPSGDEEMSLEQKFQLAISNLQRLQEIVTPD